MVQKLIMIIFLILPLHIIKAQDGRSDTILRHTLFAAYAFGHLDIFDEQASPFLYFGNSHPISFGYEYRGNSYRHTLQFSGTLSRLNANPLVADITSPIQRLSYYTTGTLTYTYLRDWQQTLQGKLQYSLGGALDNLGFLRVYKYSSRDIDSSGGSGSWEAFIMLCPVFRVDYLFNSSERIYSALSLPFISLIGRPGYNLSNTNSNVFALKNFNIVLFGGLIGWNYSLAFQQEIWNALLGELTYHCRYYNYSRYGWSDRFLIQDIMLSLNWRFGL